MTYSPPSANYSAYPVRYAFSSQQHQHHSQTPQPLSQPPSHHDPHQPQSHYPKPAYSHLHHSQIPIKVEESSDLPPVSSLTSYDSHHVKHPSSSTLPLFRFGADFSSSASPTTPSTPFTFMSHQSWPSSSASTSYGHNQGQYPGVDRYPLTSPVSPNPGGHHHGLALADDYDDEAGDELGDLPGGALGGMGLAAYGSGASGKAGEKQIRRRSSKACDQCRKSKCKCERSSPQDPCRNCVMLGTQCTFLGPSRKRGPPKGYIDAIEARLHQTEALIGILLSSKDSRAKSVLEDLAEDPLAKEIISRVDNSPYGYKGRSRGAEAPTSRARAPLETRDSDGAIHAAHPSNEWQDQVIDRLNSAAVNRNTVLPEGEVASITPDGDDEQAGSRQTTTSPTVQPATTTRPKSATSSTTQTTQSLSTDARRQRRRLDEDASHRSHSSASSRSPLRPAVEEESIEETEESGEDELAVAVGQLSLNEDEQVRFHGKMSGLHLLGVKERQDGRNEGGLWRFPKARVWPPLPPAVRNSQRSMSQEFNPRLPDFATQELLLELYFTYVHPALPIVHKQSLLEDFRNGNLSTDSPYSGESGYSDAASPISSTSHLGPRRRRVPTLLLLAIFSIAARYSSRTAEVPPPEDSSMWTAGDDYMEDAKVILDRTYAASRPSTCQALLLLGYREVGIGAMAQAWLYVGMAVRMAQDLGLHKRAEEWASVGRNLFTKAELQERRRIWYGCVVMDKYVSTYIGRPVAICERDFDTELPNVEEPEESAPWQPHPTPQVFDDAQVEESRQGVVPVPGRILSCFNQSAKLSIIISEICQNIYAIKATANRPGELSRLDKQLTKWSLELPEHLLFDPAAPKNPPPPPHILTLHMQFWCAMLLLHRPFIRHIPDSSKSLSPTSKDAEIRANSRRHYDMCVQAANHITSIVSVYCKHYHPMRSSVFLCYYVFTAAIMHVAALRTYPDDPQASRGLERCMSILQKMSVIWPSAWRALELLTGAKAQLDRVSDGASVRSSASVSEPRHKRAAEDPVDPEDVDVDVDVDVTVTDRSRIVPQENVYRQQTPSYAVLPNQAQSQAQDQNQNQNQAPSQSQSQQSYDMSMEIAQSASSSYIPSSYDRWTDASALSAQGYNASLSTSVLPQQYSTGLVDERIPVGAAAGAGSGMGSGRSERSRYPQYWNDYSAIGQMQTDFGVPDMGEMVSQQQQHGHGHAHGQGQGSTGGEHHPHAHQQSMYVSDQYSMFGNMQPSNQQ